MRRSVLLVCLLMVSAFGARAEQLVLPFSCHLSKDGGTKAIPPIRTYDVLGSRTSKVIRLCPASAGSQCRQAVVHKFDIDCDGRRVAWRAVADQMLKQRNLTLARGANADEKFLQIGEGGLAALNVLCDDVASGDSNDPELRRICLEAASVPASSLRLPAGFALVAEFGGRIERSALSTQTALSPISSANASERPSRRQTTAMALPAEVPVANIKPSAGTVAVAASGLATGKQEPQQTPVRVASAGKIMTESGQSWSTTIVKTATGQTIAGPTVQQSMVATILGLALITSLVSGIGWFATQQFLSARSRQADPYQVILRREVTDLAKPDAQMCGDLCRAGQGLIGEINVRVNDIQGAAPLRRVLLREVRSMEQFLASTLQTAPDDPREWRRMRLRLQRVVTDLIRLKDITDGARRSLTSRIISDELPRDKMEAYEVLGANPEASEKILKRLVDALRATWHPDLANGDDDRALRDRRIKQINVAWDLITEKRMEV